MVEWTEEQEADLANWWKAYNDPSTSWRFCGTYADLTGRTQKAVWCKLRRMGLTEEPHAAPVFRNLPKRPERSLAELVAAYKPAQEIYLEHQQNQRFISIDLSLVSRPVAVVSPGDFHFGSAYCRMDRMAAAVAYIVKTPHLYALPLGDDRDNFTEFRDKSALAEQVVTPEMQGYVILQAFEELAAAQKLLAIGDGNHEAFDKRHLGYDLWKEIKRIALGVPQFGSKGIIELLVGEQRYEILAMHDTLSRAVDNDASALRKEQMRFLPTADVVLAAHLHHTSITNNPCVYPLAVESGASYGQDTVYGLAGTYKDDTYGLRWGGGVLGLPTVVFFPDKHKVIGFSRTEDAVDYMRGVMGYGRR